MDDWQTRQRARTLGRELRRSSVASSPQLNPLPSNPRRFDPPAELFDNRTTEVTPIPSPAIRRSQGGQAIAWLIVTTGLVALCGGLSAIAWSLTAERGDYWNLALGLTLGGQGALIFGLVMIVSRLWRNSRFATSKLQDVHTRLGELQRTAEALATNRGGTGAFYADLARGAPPQVMLSNLKGQVDQLAARFGGN
jgi:hypothetical protein